MATTKFARKTTTGSKTARKNRRAAAKRADAIKLLKDDHREVKTWFQDYENFDNDVEKQELANRIWAAHLSLTWLPRWRHLGIGYDYHPLR